MNHSVLGEILPRFKLKITASPEEALQVIEDRMLKDKTVSGDRSGKTLFVRTPTWAQHYWSPEMTVRIETEEFTDYTTVSCLIGPRQSVWAMFAFFHIAIILFTTFSAIYGFVHYKQLDDPTWLYIVPFGVILSLSVFVTSKFGQKKGRDQMLHLVSFLYHSLDSITSVERLERK